MQLLINSDWLALLVIRNAQKLRITFLQKLIFKQWLHLAMNYVAEHQFYFSYVTGLKNMYFVKLHYLTDFRNSIGMHRHTQTSSKVIFSQKLLLLKQKNSFKFSSNFFKVFKVVCRTFLSVVFIYFSGASKVVRQVPTLSSRVRRR